MHFEEVETINHWVNLAREKEAVARAFRDDKRNCRQAWEATGYAIEYLLKAVVMRKHCLNAWPMDPKSPFRSHNLRQLIKDADLSPITAPQALKANIATVLTWRREQAYTRGRLPRAMSRSMVDAAFGQNGVAQWLRSKI